MDAGSKYFFVFFGILLKLPIDWWIEMVITYNCPVIKLQRHAETASRLVQDSSAVRRLFFQLAGAMGRQRALHTENSGFSAATLRRHISTFRGYRILFSIRNPYINRFANHFSIHS
jgi:hypothetical protein